MGRQDELGQLARSYNQMADQVEQTIVALRRFVADAAHELHTPLTALRTNLELASEEAETEERAAFLARAQAQIARLESLTSGLLDLSRLEAHGQEAEHSRLDLAALAREVSEPYASQADQAGLAFTLDLPSTPVMVQGHASHLVRALGNLLDNACKFTPEGGSVRLSLRQEGEWAVARVEDTGIGIPEGDLAQLGGRFHRGANTAGYPGNGLGLAIVWAIAEAHGGTVAAESTGRGACFTLKLPLAT